MTKVVSQEEWLRARKGILAQEEEVNLAREALASARQQLPKVRVEKEYNFEGPGGKVTLLDMFEGRPQLIVYHFMFDPSWDEGCKHCSLLADNIGHLAHLHARDTTLAIVSRAPYPKIEAFKARMGWAAPWYSSFDSSFNYDFHVTLDDEVAPVEYNYKTKLTLLENNELFTEGEASGLSVFDRDGENIYHTYSSYDGEDVLYGTFNYLDLTPLGRREGPGRPWLRHHDKYDA